MLHHRIVLAAEIERVEVSSRDGGYYLDVSRYKKGIHISILPFIL